MACASRAASSSCRRVSSRSRCTNRSPTYGVPANLRVTAIFGGVSIVPQKNELRRGTDIIVATPGRLLDHLQQRTVDLSGVKVLTLDEADRMLDMGFLPPLRRILAVLPRERQTMLFSATLSSDVIRLAESFTRDAERVDVSGAEMMAPTVMHHVHPVSHERKGDLLTHILRQTPSGQALVFCRTKHGSNRVGQYLERAGMKTAVIHGNKSQGARTRALGDFKAGRVNVLVATDIAARGLDIVQLPLVVNFDLPMVAEDYIHRAGRTGRAGLAGRAVIAGLARRSRVAARHSAAAAGAGGACRAGRIPRDIAGIAAGIETAAAGTAAYPFDESAAFGAPSQLRRTRNASAHPVSFRHSTIAADRFASRGPRARRPRPGRLTRTAGRRQCMPRGTLA